MTTNDIGFYAQVRTDAVIRLAAEHYFDHTSKKDETVVITKVSAIFNSNGTVSVFGDGVVRRKDGSVGTAKRTTLYLAFAEMPVRVQIDVMEALRYAYLLAAAKVNEEHASFLKVFDTFALAN